MIEAICATKYCDLCELIVLLSHLYRNVDIGSSFINKIVLSAGARSRSRSILTYVYETAYKLICDSFQSVLFQFLCSFLLITRQQIIIVVNDSAKNKRNMLFVRDKLCEKKMRK